LLFGFAGALRRSELVALQVEDVAIVAGGLRLRIVRGKTDQAGQGAEIDLSRGRYAETCPARAFEAWQAVAKRKAGSLFRRISTGGGSGAIGSRQDHQLRCHALPIPSPGSLLRQRNERAAAKARAIERNRLIATWRGSIHGSKHPIRTRPHDRPLVALQHDEREPPAHKVLLISEILIRGHHHVETDRLAQRHRSAPRFQEHPSPSVGLS
jgi:hypothetical protein